VSKKEPGASWPGAIGEDVSQPSGAGTGAAWEKAPEAVRTKGAVVEGAVKGARDEGGAFGPAPSAVPSAEGASSAVVPTGEGAEQWLDESWRIERLLGQWKTPPDKLSLGRPTPPAMTSRLGADSRGVVPEERPGAPQASRPTGARTQSTPEVPLPTVPTDNDSPVGSRCRSPLRLWDVRRRAFPKT